MRRANYTLNITITKIDDDHIVFLLGEEHELKYILAFAHVQRPINMLFKTSNLVCRIFNRICHEKLAKQKMLIILQHLSVKLKHVRWRLLEKRSYPLDESLALVVEEGWVFREGCPRLTPIRVIHHKDVLVGCD